MLSHHYHHDHHDHDHRHHDHDHDHHHHQAAVDLKYSCGDPVRVGVNALQSSGLYFLHRHTAVSISYFVFRLLRHSVCISYFIWSELSIQTLPVQVLVFCMFYW